MKIKRLFRNFAEDLLGVKIVRSSRVALVFEEIYLKRLFERYRVDCVFDVGANEGQYARRLRERVGYKGSIISFEPMPSAVNVLKTRAAVDDHWYVEPIGLGYRIEKRTFNVMKYHEFSSFNKPLSSDVSLIDEMNTISERLTVDVSTLDVFYHKYKALLKFRRPFLKMDTQGSDLEVAEGGGEILQSFVGLQSELAIKCIYEHTPNYVKALDYYTKKGFELSALVYNNEGTFPKLIEIDCIMYNNSVESGQITDTRQV